jgi:hypothetical protein
MLEFKIREYDYENQLGLYLFDRVSEDEQYIAKAAPLEWVRIPFDGAYPEDPGPWLKLRKYKMREFFQGLTDELARMGYRASNDRAAGELEATRAHLQREQQISDDVRKFLFSQHSVEGLRGDT